jgi:hypothetical protein
VEVVKNPNEWKKCEVNGYYYRKEPFNIGYPGTSLINVYDHITKQILLLFK